MKNGIDSCNVAADIEKPHTSFLKLRKGDD